MERLSSHDMLSLIKILFPLQDNLSCFTLRTSDFHTPSDPQGHIPIIPTRTKDSLVPPCPNNTGLEFLPRNPSNSS